MANLTPGQQAYIDHLKTVETTIALTGTVGRTEVIDSPEDDPRPFLVRAWVAADDGQEAYYDFYPPLSSEEQKAEDERLAAEAEALRQAQQDEIDAQVAAAKDAGDAG